MDTLRRRFSLSMMCRVLQVSRSGFMLWRRRPPSKRRRQEGRLQAEIRAAHERARWTHGPSGCNAIWRRTGCGGRASDQTHPPPVGACAAGKTPVSRDDGCAPCVAGGPECAGAMFSESSVPTRHVGRRYYRRGHRMKAGSIWLALIPIRFQDETNHGTSVPWPDHAESTKYWLGKPVTPSRALESLVALRRAQAVLLPAVMGQPRANRCAAWRLQGFRAPIAGAISGESASRSITTSLGRTPSVTDDLR